jgi:hypothetical protein
MALAPAVDLEDIHDVPDTFSAGMKPTYDEAGFVTHYAKRDG